MYTKYLIFSRKNFNQIDEKIHINDSLLMRFSESLLSLRNRDDIANRTFRLWHSTRKSREKTDKKRKNTKEKKGTSEMTRRRTVESREFTRVIAYVSMHVDKNVLI